MAIETIAIAGLIVFWAAFLIFAVWFGKESIATYEHRRKGLNMKRVAVSKQLVAATAAGLFVLGVAYIALILDQGFFMREAGIVIWWPRFVAYSLVYASLSYSISTYLWTYVKDKVVATLAGFAFWVVAGVLGSFTGAEHYHWVYFGVAFIPLLSAFFIWCWRKSRTNDEVANGLILVALLLQVGFGVTWGLSPAGADIIDLEVAFWLYFGLEILTFIVFPWYLIFTYVSKKYAQHTSQKHKNYPQQQQQQYYSQQQPQQQQFQVLNSSQNYYYQK
jgi:bacteriorhodopsin